MQTHLYPYRVFSSMGGEGAERRREIDRQRKRERNTRGWISKGSMSSIDSIGEAGLSLMASTGRGYRDLRRTFENARRSVSAALYCYSRFSARSLERARGASRGETASFPKEASRAVASLFCSRIRRDTDKRSLSRSRVEILLSRTLGHVTYANIETY